MSGERLSVLPSRSAAEESGFDAVLATYEPHLEGCRERLRAEFFDGAHGPLLARYVERGKLLRALLVYSYGAAVGGAAPALAPAADAVEILHAASLVHDDIIDGATERRGAPALHVEIGRGAAIVLGDYLLLRAFEILARSAETEPAGRVAVTIERLSRYAQQCCLGEIAEVLGPAGARTEGEYLAVVRGKTAAPFAAAATLAATFAGGSRDLVARAHDYGIAVGIAYQIRDDLLDLGGDPELLGKPVANSFSLGRPMLPLIQLEQYGSRVAKLQCRRLRRTEAHRGVVLGLLERDGILARTEATARAHVAAAVETTEALDPSPARDALRALAAHAFERHA